MTTPPGDSASEQPNTSHADAIRAVIIGAGSRGNRVFAELMRTQDIGWRVTAVVEPDEGRREVFRVRHAVPVAAAFASIDAFLQASRVADIAFICTPDVTHYSICARLSAAGYDVVLEKPIATSLADCLALLDIRQAHGNRIFVAHVLRYSPFFLTLKQIVASRHYGIVRNLRLVENVGHWHFAHSYVRGNWRRREESAPIVLTKCSHDLDIIAWLLEHDRPTFVSSFGTLEYFTEANAPPGSAARCFDCPLQATCRYSAPRFYLGESFGWPQDVIAPAPDSLAARRRALETGPYGRCVWRCDNDVCDNQTVTVQFESGIHASLGMYALTADNTRRIALLLDDAEITGDIFLPLLRMTLPEIVDYHMPAEGIFHNLVFVSIRKEYPGHARKVMNGLWGQGLMSLAKVIVVVDAEIDVKNAQEVWWYALNNIDPERDVHFTLGPADDLDHAARGPAYGSKMGIDGTRKLPEEGFTREWPDAIRMDEAVKAKIDAVWDRLGL